MNDPHVIDELSAFLDGEAREPERIARHLQTCEDCARHHIQLRKLSAHVQAMPLPEVRPEFLTRVMAHAAEMGPVRARGRLAFAWPRFAAVLCAVAFVAGAGYVWFAPHPVSAPGEAPGTAETEWTPLIAEGPDPAPIEQAGEELLQDVTYDDLIAVLAEAWTESDEDTDAGAAEDAFDEVDSLEPQDAAIFQEVVNEYLGQLKKG